MVGGGHRPPPTSPSPAGPEGTAAAAARQHHADQLKAHVAAERATDVSLAPAAAGTTEQRNQLLKQQQPGPAVAAFDKNRALRLICNGFEVLTGKMPEPAPRPGASVGDLGGRDDNDDGDNTFTLASVCWEKAGIITPSRRDASVEMTFSNGMTAVTEGIVVSFTNGSMCHLTIRDPVDAIESLDVSSDTPVLLFSFARDSDKSVRQLRKSSVNLFVVEVGVESNESGAARKPNGVAVPESTKRHDSASGGGASASAPKASLKPPDGPDAEQGDGADKTNADGDGPAPMNVDTAAAVAAAKTAVPVTLEAITNSVPLFVNTIARQPSSNFYQHVPHQSQSHVAAGVAAQQPTGGASKHRIVPSQEIAFRARTGAGDLAAKKADTLAAGKEVVAQQGAREAAPAAAAVSRGGQVSRKASHLAPHQGDPALSAAGRSSQGLHAGHRMLPASAAPPYGHVHAVPAAYHPAAFYYGQSGMPAPAQEGEYGAMQLSHAYYAHPAHQAPPGHPHHAHHPGQHGPPPAYMPHPAAHPPYLVHPHHGHPAHLASHSHVQSAYAYAAEYAMHSHAAQHHHAVQKHAASVHEKAAEKTDPPSVHRGVDALAQAAAAAKPPPYGNGHAEPVEPKGQELRQNGKVANKDGAKAGAGVAIAPRGHTASTKSSDSRDAMEALVRMGNGNGICQPRPNSALPDRGTSADANGVDDANDGSGGGSSAAAWDRAGLARDQKGSLKGRARSHSDSDGGTSGNSSFTSGRVDASGQPLRKRGRR